MTYSPNKFELIEFEKNFLAANFMAVEKQACNFIQKGFVDLRVHNFLAISYAKQNKFKLAEIQFLKIINEGPKDFNNFYNLGNLYKENKKYKLSIKCFINALKIKPNCKKTLFLIAASYFRIENFQNAIFYLDAILEFDKLNKEAFLQKGVSTFDVEILII